MQNINDIKFHYIILEIPEDTVKLIVDAQIIEDDKLVTIEGVYNTKDIFKARRDFLDNVEFGDDYDVRYVLTDEGRAWIEEQEKKRNEG